MRLILTVSVPNFWASASRAFDKLAIRRWQLDAKPEETDQIGGGRRSQNGRANPVERLDRPIDAVEPQVIAELRRLGGEPVEIAVIPRYRATVLVHAVPKPAQVRTECVSHHQVKVGILCCAHSECGRS